MDSEYLRKIIQKQRLEIELLNKIICSKDRFFAREISKVKFYYENIISLIPGNVYWLNKKNVFLGCK